ncbi:hypothetical protein BJX70DRAFT_393542 [Aspergillus crustosus]
MTSGSQDGQNGQNQNNQNTRMNLNNLIRRRSIRRRVVAPAVIDLTIDANSTPNQVITIDGCAEPAASASASASVSAPAPAPAPSTPAAQTGIAPEPPWAPKPLARSHTMRARMSVPNLLAGAAGIATASANTPSDVSRTQATPIRVPMPFRCPNPLPSPGHRQLPIPVPSSPSPALHTRTLPTRTLDSRIRRHTMTRRARSLPSRPFAEKQAIAKAEAKAKAGTTTDVDAKAKAIIDDSADAMALDTDCDSDTEITLPPLNLNPSDETNPNTPIGRRFAQLKGELTVAQQKIQELTTYNLNGVHNQITKVKSELDIAHQKIQNLTAENLPGKIELASKQKQITELQGEIYRLKSQIEQYHAVPANDQLKKTMEAEVMHERHKRLTAERRLFTLRATVLKGNKELEAALRKVWLREAEEEVLGKLGHQERERANVNGIVEREVQRRVVEWKATRK